MKLSCEQNNLVLDELLMGLSLAVVGGLVNLVTKSVLSSRDTGEM